MTRNLILNLLQMSRDREKVDVNEFAQQMRSSPQKVIQNLNKNLEGLVKIQENLILIPKSQKMNLVYNAILSGISLEQVIATLHWREFENFCLMVFDYNNFQTIQNFHFSQNKKRYEIDVIGMRKPLIFAVDAKKWKTGHSSALKTMVKNQIKRVKAFSKSLQKRVIRQKLDLKNWRRAKVIPMIITSKMYAIKLFQGVPILPFFKLNQFINEYYRYLEVIMQFSVKFSIQKSLF